MSLITGVELQSYCGLEIGDEDNYFADLANEIIGLVSNYCGRTRVWGYIEGSETLDIVDPWLKQDAEEYFSGDGSLSLILTRRPVKSITHVKELSDIEGDSWDTIDSGYYQCRGKDIAAGILKFIHGTKFTDGNNNFKIRYTAGWTNAEIPFDLKLALKEWGKYFYETKISDSNVTSRSLGPQSGSMSFRNSSDIPSNVVTLLSPYKQVRFI
jgi:hypothetical protein